MPISTDRATVEERAAAWDYLMSSTETGSVAITKAWCWLRDHVKAREAAERVAGEDQTTSPGSRAELRRATSVTSRSD
jgi:hypothetical protein